MVYLCSVEILVTIRADFDQLAPTDEKMFFENEELCKCKIKALKF